MDAVMLFVELSALTVLAVSYRWVLRGLPWRERLLATAVPVSQGVIIAIYLGAAAADSFLESVALYVWAVGALCLAADLAVLPGLRASAALEAETSRVLTSEEMLAATRFGEAQAARQLEAAKAMGKIMADELRAMLTSMGDAGRADRCLAERLSLVGSPGCNGEALRRFSDNAVADALVSLQAERAAAGGIAFSATLSIPETVAIDDVDLCAALSNLTGNAFAGAKTMPAGQRAVVLRARTKGSMLVVAAENGYCRDGRKRAVAESDLAIGAHGWGLDILRALADRYGGAFAVDDDGRRWVASISLRWR